MSLELLAGSYGSLMSFQEAWHLQLCSRVEKGQNKYELLIKHYILPLALYNRFFVLFCFNLPWGSYTAPHGTVGNWGDLALKLKTETIFELHSYSAV